MTTIMLHTAIVSAILVLSMFLSSSLAVSIRKSSSADSDLGVHNILPSFRTEAKHCYQCAYTPPKPYSTKSGRKSRLPNSKTSAKSASADAKKLSHGGWDKCLGPFSAEQATDYGVDVWMCRSYCYTRRDPNGDIFRGCYKGEYGVDPSLFGCHRQADAVYCFCDGDRCNNEQAPPEDYR